MIGNDARQFWWSGTSFVVVSVAGLVTSALIARYASANALGVFAQATAVFFVGGLLASLGVQLSVLQKTSARSDDPGYCATTTCAAWLMAIALGIAAGAVCFVASAWFARLMAAPDLEPALLGLVPGLFFFGQNKVLLNYLNGVRRIRALAIMQMVRVAVLALAVGVHLYAGLPHAWLAASFSVAEVVLFLCLVVVCAPVLKSVRAGAFGGHVREHFSFGLRNLPGDAAHLLNLRVDVLVLGYFLGDTEVGYYALANQVILGMIQLLNAVGYPLTPVMGRMAGRERYRLLAWWVRRTARRLYRLGAPAALAALALYPLVPHVVINDAAYMASYPPFVILLAGWFAMCGYRPMIALLTQLGRPGAYSLLRIAALLVNVSTSVVLVSRFGLEGAAAATALSFIVTVLGLRYLGGRSLGYAL